MIQFYNHGGGQGLGLDVANQTLPADALELTRQEQQQLVAFLQSLTDTNSLDLSTPVKLPQSANQQLNQRTIGGDY